MLSDKAYQRFKAHDSPIGEKIVALGVTGTMKAKTKLEMGIRRCPNEERGRGLRNRSTPKRGRGLRKGKISFNDAVQRARRGVQSSNSNNLIKVTKQALSSIGGKNISLPKKRIIPIPKTVDFL